MSAALSELHQINCRKIRILLDFFFKNQEKCPKYSEIKSIFRNFFWIFFAIFKNLIQSNKLQKKSDFALKNSQKSGKSLKFLRHFIESYN